MTDISKKNLLSYIALLWFMKFQVASASAKPEVEKLPMECRSDESLRFLEGISREAPGGIQVDLFIDSTFLGVFDVYRLACSWV